MRMEKASSKPLRSDGVSMSAKMPGSSHSRVIRSDEEDAESEVNIRPLTIVLTQTILVRTRTT